MARVALGQFAAARAGPAGTFPWGTFAVNVLGCFAIGAVAAWVESKGGSHPSHPFLVGGLLGGFTTFSTFGLETLRLLEADRAGLAALYALGSLGLGVLAVAFAFWLVRH